METLDSIKIRGLEVHVYQTKSGYRFSLDALLLADFPEIRGAKSIVELGSGSGVVSLLLAKKYPRASVVGIEVQQGLFGRAVRSAEYNDLSGRVTFLHMDLKDTGASLPAESADLVVMNPPFRRPGTGRISPGDERANARHELTAGISDVTSASARFLRNGGRLCIVHHPERLVELFECMRASGIEPKRMRMVHSHTADNARIVLVEAVKQAAPGLKVLPPLFVYERERVYTPEMRAFYGFPAESGPLA